MRLVAVTLLGSLYLGLAGCSGDGDVGSTPKIPEGYEVVTGTQLCGGEAISQEASRALKVITGASRFEASVEEHTMAAAAAALVEAFPVPTAGSEDVCRIYTPIGTPDFDLEITWHLSKGGPANTPAPKYTLLKMGKQAGAATDEAYVQFECRSDRLLRSSRAAYIDIGVERRAFPREREGNGKALKDAYATVAHSVALAMAKELRCEKHGGLPEKPVLDPA